MATPPTPAPTTTPAGDKEPTDPNQIKADMQKCPRWILAKLQAERKQRGELESQLKTMLPELDKLNAELEAWRMKLVLLEAEMGDKDPEDISNEKQSQLRSLEEQLAQNETQINNKRKLLQRKNEEVANFKWHIKEMQESKQEATLKMKEALAQKDQDLRKKQEEIDKLKADISRYATFLKTRVSSGAH